jgi:hypothetical protein
MGNRLTDSNQGRKLRHDSPSGRRAHVQHRTSLAHWQGRGKKKNIAFIQASPSVQGQGAIVWRSPKPSWVQEQCISCRMERQHELHIRDREEARQQSV